MENEVEYRQWYGFHRERHRERERGAPLIERQRQRQMGQGGSVLTIISKQTRETVRKDVINGK